MVWSKSLAFIKTDYDKNLLDFLFYYYNFEKNYIKTESQNFIQN